MQTAWPRESWNLAIPPVPERSRLYCLAPMAIGTPEVESLTGYVARLAEAHSVTVADLVGAELSDASSVPLLPPRPHPKSFNGFYTQPYSINGMGKKTKRWCFVLEKATLRNDLSRLTLLAFEPLLSQISLFRRRCAWCPACFEERRCRGGTVYESLLWTMELVRLCPNHCQFLEEVCRRCQRSSGAAPRSLFTSRLLFALWDLAWAQARRRLVKEATQPTGVGLPNLGCQKHR